MTARGGATPTRVAPFPRNRRCSLWPPGSEFDIDGGGSVETFGSKGDAKKRYDYVHSISSSGAIFAEYEYLHDTVLLRLSHYLRPKQAAGYDRALK